MNTAGVLPSHQIWVPPCELVGFYSKQKSLCLLRAAISHWKAHGANLICHLHQSLHSRSTSLSCTCIHRLGHNLWTQNCAAGVPAFTEQSAQVLMARTWTSVHTHTCRHICTQAWTNTHRGMHTQTHTPTCMLLIQWENTDEIPKEIWKVLSPGNYLPLKLIVFFFLINPNSLPNSLGLEEMFF